MFAGQGVTLTFLSFVEIACIPLNTFLGPALEVYTNTESTKTWFNTHLLRSVEQDNTHDDHSQVAAQWWTRGYFQSDLGVLVKVNGDLKIHGLRGKITELLLYACESLVPERDQDVLLTPPRSSSPSAGHEDLPDAEQEGGCKAAVYARLISSDLCHKASQYRIDLCQAPEGSALESPRFLTPPPEETPNEQHLLQKRQRLESLFDDATRQNKKSRRRGGESVAKLMASNDNSSISLQTERDGQPLAGEDEASVSSIAARTTRPRLGKAQGLSRSQSLGSIHGLDDIRPRSRNSNLSVQKRSSLNCVASFATFESSFPVGEVSDGLEQQNKNALTRVVMAGMRMYGFQPKRRPTLSRATTEESSQPLTSDATPGDEDEYKNMYHHTLKAVSFSFRNHMAKEIISQHIMRDVVDRQLMMFCNDPMQTDQNSESFMSGFVAEKSK